MSSIRDVLSEYLNGVGDLPSARKLLYRVNCWSRHAPIELPITSEKVATFQTSALAQRLSPVTVNDTVADVLFLLKETGRTVTFEVKRLDEPAPNPQPPAVREIGKLYAAAGQAEWPTRWTAQERAWFWQGFVCLGYHWPFRNGDIFRLTTEHLFDKPGEQFPRVELQRGRKTGATYAYPITDTCRRHLANLLRITKTPQGHSANGSLFMMKPGSVRLLRKELKRLCGIAGIPEQTPKKIRSASISAYECLPEGCGELAHHGVSVLGVRKHYVPMIRKLARWIHQFEVPDEMLDPSERRRNRESLARLLIVAKRLKSDEIHSLARMAEVM